MNTLKIEWVPVAFLADYDPKAFPDDVPVVRLEALREHLEMRLGPGMHAFHPVLEELLEFVKAKS